MTPNREFFQSMIQACQAEKQKLRIDFERQDAVEKFCEKILQDMPEGAKENPDGGMVHK